MRMRARFLAAVVGVAILLPAGGAGAQEQSVDVRDNSFGPATVTVTAGDTVTWTQSGANPHSVTADDGSFDSSGDCPSGCMGPGDTFERTFTEAGEFGYYCKVHGGPGQGMAGTVVVQAAAAEEDDEDAGGNDVGQDGQAGDTAADEDERLPRTGGPALVLAGLILLAGGAALVRRRTG